MDKFETRTTCRSCKSDRLRVFMDYGQQPLANSLRERNDFSVEPTYPMTLAFCEECYLVQIRETVHPDVMFKDYLYFSSCSPAFVKHAHDLADRLVSEMHLDYQNLVIEAASNDGYLLKRYQQHGVKVIGVDPARNIAEQANSEGVPTECDYFGSRVGMILFYENKFADVFHANNVFAHTYDQNDFLQGVRYVLKKFGTAVFEFPYLGNMVKDLEFDTVYHEHLCYFSALSLRQLFKRNGFGIVGIEKIPVHGGSLRVFAKKDVEHDETLPIWQEERDAGLDKWETYADFQPRVDALGESLRKTLVSFGPGMIAYGAAAKGSTLLNYFRLGKYLTYCVDRSAHKQGRIMPGPRRLPIFSVDELQHASCALVFTWNFAREIIEQNRPWIEAGGTFVFPLPSGVRVVNRNTVSSALQDLKV